MDKDHKVHAEVNTLNETLRENPVKEKKDTLWGDIYN